MQSLDGTRMTTSASGLAKFGIWLRNKRNFYLYWIFATGIPVSVVFIWKYGALISNPLWLVFLVAISFLGSFMSGFCMWHFFRWYFPSMANEKRNDAA
jgi:hypothetical protein